MTRSIDADYTQTFLLPPSIEDWISADSPARFIRDFVAALDLKEFDCGDVDSLRRGRPHYSSALLLRVWMYGWMHNVRTCRALEYACGRNIELMWLAGCQQPDHNTLWRFWGKHRQAIEKLFKRSVRMAFESGLARNNLHAVDGTKIAAVAGNRKAVSRAELERRLAAVAAQLAEIDRLNEAPESQDTYDPLQIAEQLRGHVAQREWLCKQMALMDQQECNDVVPHEPEARRVPTGEGTRWGYNAQAVVDAEAGIVVAQAVTNEQNDMKQLVPMLESVRENTGEFADVTLADAGYASQEQLGRAEQMGAQVVAHPQRSATDNSPLHSDNFTYDPEQDVCICPATGQTLSFARIKRAHGTHHEARVYRCCAINCPLASQCTKNRKGREIEITQWRNARLRQRHPDEQRKQLLARRKVIVEPLFAHIKHAGRFRRFTLTSLAGASLQWAWVCFMQNFTKLMKLPTEQNSHPRPCKLPFGSPNCLVTGLYQLFTCFLQLLSATTRQKPALA